MEDVYRLCNDYKKHLANIPYLSSYPDELTQDKLKIIESLLLCRTPKGIKYLLTDPRGPRYQMILQKHRSDWTWTFIAGFLTVITFPISLPILLAWSWIVRGNPNFLKSDGAILVDKLLRLSEASLGVSPIDIDTHTTLETSQLRTSSMDNQLSRQRASRFHGMASLLARHTLKQDSSDASSFPAVIDTAPNLYAAMFDLEKDIFNDAGNPQFLASRARSFSYVLDDHFVVDSYCGFKYSNQAPLVVTISILTSLDPIMPHFAEDGHARQQTEQPPHEGVVTTLSKRVHGLFFSPPTFESMFKEAQIDRGYHTTREFYEKALSLARNDRQRISSIEGIINQLDRKYVSDQEDYIQCINEKKSIEYALARGGIVAEHRMNGFSNLSVQIERHLKKMNDGLALIEDYYHQLPANYRAMTPSADHIEGTINLVFQLIECDEIGKARLHYLSIPQFTPFLKLAFPHLLAMKHQLRAIFCLLSTHGYHVRAHYGEPFELEVTPHSLRVYLSNGVICCAARTDDEIERFVISDETLGSEASAIRDCLSHERCVFSSQQKKIIFEAVASRGYYEINEPVPIAALTLFEESHALVQQYHPALAMHLETMTLAPLRALMEAGKAAKQHTPYAVRKALSDQASAESCQRMYSRDTYIPFHQLNDDEWSELLATTDTTPAYQSL